jgi:hypothetical protein
MQESVLFVLGDMLDVLPNCSQRMFCVINQVGSADNRSDAKGKSR